MKYWVIAPYHFDQPEIWQRVWQFNLHEGFISLGWPDLKNVSKLELAQIRQRHRAVWPKAPTRSAEVSAKMLHKFWNEIKPGHIVVARAGRKSIAAVGTVTSAPYYQPSKAKSSFAPERPYASHIDVDWHDEPRNLQFDRQVFGLQTIHTISDDKFRDLTRIKGKPGGVVYPDELEDEEQHLEGGRKRVVVNAFERSSKARDACLKHHGYNCSVCDMLFAERYGEIGISFIHVHHKNPIALRNKKYSVDPKNDLIPVCPNCHAMLHTSNPPLTIRKLRHILSQRQAKN